MRLRDLMTIVENAAKFSYVGNCTNAHTAPYLEDMMEDAVPVSYRVLMRAVGRDQLAHIFPDFDWSNRPRDLTMANDPNVSYYRSTFKGVPCFYVRESGIEYIFADMDYEDRSLVRPMSKNATGIAANGELVPLGRPSVFFVRIEGDVAEVSQSAAKTPESGSALADFLVGHQIATVIDDGEERPVEEFIDWLKE